jgi:hypothetical protein
MRMSRPINTDALNLNSPLFAARDELRLFALKGGLPARNFSLLYSFPRPALKVGVYGKHAGQMKEKGIV